MASEYWNITRVGNVAAINPDVLGRDWPHTHIRYIDISSVSEGQIQTPPQLMRLLDAPSRAKRLVQQGDTVLSTVRPNRRSMFFADNVGADWVVSTGFAVLRPKQQFVEPRFLYSCIFNQTFTEYLIAREKGAAYPAVSPDDIANAEISLPPITEQRAIADILGSLDDKIELNRRMNETLEEMARSIFKAWFVDFEPVKAKAAGADSFPGMPQDIFDTLPTTFTNSELGPIPTGWEAVPVYEIAEYINGAAFKNTDFTADDSGLPVIKIAELKGGISKQTKYTKEKRKPTQRISDGDILFSWSGSPDTSIDTFIYTLGDAWLNQHIFRVISTPKEDKCFMYYLLRYLKPVFIEICRNKQTTGLGHVTVKDLQRLLIIRPAEDVLSSFCRIASPLFDQTYETIVESRTLASLRDTLLPKLISGELRVPDEILTKK